MLINIIFFTLYGIGLLWIGLRFKYLAKDSEGYLLGGRTLGPVTSALSAGASDMSAWLLLGLPGLAFATGLSSIWLPIGLILGVSAMWIFMAKPLRKFSIALNSLTIPQYLSDRFHDKQGILKFLFGLIITVFFTVYMSSGFVAAEKILGDVFHINPLFSLGTMLIIVAVFTAVGGYASVVWTDALQGIIMMLALIVVPIVILFYLLTSGLGGLSQVNWGILPADSSFLSILTLVGWGLGYFGQPHIIVRFMGIKSEKDVNKAKLVAIVWTFIGLVGALGVGLFGYAYMHQYTLGIKDPEKIIMVISKHVFPIWIAAWVPIAILSASMSTISSQLLVTVSSLKDDIAGFLFRKVKSAKMQVNIYRIFVVIVMLITIVVTFYVPHSILKIVSFAWGGLGSSLGPVLLISLYYRNMSLVSAVAGIIVGIGIYFIFTLLHGGIFDLYALIPGFFANILAIFISNMFVSKDKKASYATTFDKCSES